MSNNSNFSSFQEERIYRHIGNKCGYSEITISMRSISRDLNLTYRKVRDSIYALNKAGLIKVNFNQGRSINIIAFAIDLQKDYTQPIEAPEYLTNTDLLKWLQTDPNEPKELQTDQFGVDIIQLLYHKYEQSDQFTTEKLHKTVSSLNQTDPNDVFMYHFGRLPSEKSEEIERDNFKSKSINQKTKSGDIYIRKRDKIKGKGGMGEKPIKKREKDFEDAFLQFWERYPRKHNMIGAKKAFKKLFKRPDFALERILKGLEGYLTSIEENATERQFILHPETFIKKERFNDEYTTTNYDISSHPKFLRRARYLFGKDFGRKKQNKLGECTLSKGVEQDTKATRELSSSD